jgi:hypothetical protein
MDENPHIRGIKTAPRGNPAIDRTDLERGLEKLARVVGH